MPQLRRKQKCGIITTLVSSFIGLAYEGISSFLHNKRHAALHKVVKAVDREKTIQHNKLMHLEDSVVMYGIYNAETLEQLTNTVHYIHNTTSSNKKIFAGQQGTAALQSLYANAQGIQHYCINSLLYLRTVKDKYVLLHKELITQLHIYVTATRILAKGYLPISLITLLELKEILNEVRNTVRKTNPDHDLVIKRLHLYYDMKIVTFGIDSDRNLIVQFPVFIQPYPLQPLMLYQIETVPVPIIDQNVQAQSYTHLQVDRPYIALNSETYIT